MSVECATEEWRDVPGFEGHYQVSNLGRVKSLARVLTNCLGQQRRYPERIMRLKHRAIDDYVCVILRLGGTPTTFKVHRLVAAAFYGERDSSWHVDHLNGDRADNRVTNLMWKTCAENAANRTVAMGATGEVGVFPNPSSIRPFRVYVSRNYKKKYLGCFETIGEAKAARDRFLASEAA